MKQCTIPNCTTVLYSKGFCKKHYDKNRRHSDPLFEETLRKDQPCSVAHCDKPFFANDLCQQHNARLQRHGDPLYVNPKCNRDGNYKQRALVKSAVWKKKNPKLNASFNKARKTRMRNAIGDKAAIRDFYLNCPMDYVVDHIIPLNHADVSGLHCIWNTC